MAARRQDGRERERGRGRAYRRREEDEAHRCQSRAYPVAVASAFFGKFQDQLNFVRIMSAPNDSYFGCSLQE